MTNFQNETPVQIDTRMYELQLIAGELSYKIARAERAAQSEWRESYKQDWENDAAEKREQLIPVINELREIDAEFVRRGGWTRYQLVTNVGGHVHSSTYCSTCRPTTDFDLVFQCSGMTAEELVELAGERACSVCFKDIEGLITDSKSKLPYDIAAREAAEKLAAEKAEKLAEKAKNWVAEKGQPIYCTNGERPKTRRSAEIAAVTAYAKTKHYELLTERCRRNDRAEGVEKFSGIAAKHAATVEECVAGLLLFGTETETEIRAKIVEKGDKKFAKMTV